MTKNEQRDVKMVNAFMICGMHDAAARTLSAAIRAARTSKSAAELRKVAADWSLTSHPAFIC